ncbi:acyl-CoA thioesterase [Pseudorhodoferax sp.]|uniref:acyl-CoA thioesterase n=1 Tax=Pseudorhodoferax sp. TaxID=1993553 RepID=UPI002DD62D75|nr:thioesterase family protein [Pseudorhodoferax sp.]
MPTDHPLDTALALQRDPTTPGRWQGAPQPAWANMVGPYGGITAAQLLQAVMLDERRLGEPLALTVNFAGPVADRPFTIDAVPVRTNRSTQHWTMQLSQGGEVCTTATAVCAARRPTWSAAEAVMPVVPAADAVPMETRKPPIAWVQRYDLHFVEGGWPDFSRPQELADSRTVLWLRDHPARVLDAAALAALADVFYPRVFRRRQRAVPAGTVSLTTYFHADAAELAAVGAQPVLGVAQGRRFVNGFFDQSAEIWSPDGRLLASSHQVVYFKE